MGEKLTITVQGKRKTFPTIQAAAKALKMPYGVLYQRLFIMNWSKAKAVSTKVRPLKRKRKARGKK